MNIFNWIKLQIKEALEFEEVCMELQTLIPNKDNKNIYKIKKIAKKLAAVTPENATDTIKHLYNYLAYPDLLEKEIKRLEKIVNENQTIHHKNNNK